MQAQDKAQDSPLARGSGSGHLCTGSHYQCRRPGVHKFCSNPLWITRLGAVQLQNTCSHLSTARASQHGQALPSQPRPHDLNLPIPHKGRSPLSDGTRDEEAQASLKYTTRLATTAPFHCVHQRKKGGNNDAHRCGLQTITRHEVRNQSRSATEGFSCPGHQPYNSQAYSSSTPATRNCSALGPGPMKPY